MFKYTENMFVHYKKEDLSTEISHNRISKLSPDIRADLCCCVLFEDWDGLTHAVSSIKSVWIYVVITLFHSEMYLQFWFVKTEKSMECQGQY